MENVQKVETSPRCGWLTKSGEGNEPTFPSHYSSKHSDICLNVRHTTSSRPFVSRENFNYIKRLFMELPWEKTHSIKIRKGTGKWLRWFLISNFSRSIWENDKNQHNFLGENSKIRLQEKDWFWWFYITILRFLNSSLWWCLIFLISCLIKKLLKILEKGLKNSYLYLK